MKYNVSFYVGATTVCKEHSHVPSHRNILIGCRSSKNYTSNICLVFVEWFPVMLFSLALIELSDLTTRESYTRWVYVFSQDYITAETDTLLGRTQELWLMLYMLRCYHGAKCLSECSPLKMCGYWERDALLELCWHESWSDIFHFTKINAWPAIFNF